MNEQTTSWYLKLMDFVSSPLKKIVDNTMGAQKKIADLGGATRKLAESQNAFGRDFKRNVNQTNQLLDYLKQRMDRAYNVKNMQAYKRMIDNTTGSLKKMQAAANAPTGGFFSKWKSQLNDAASEIPGLSRGLSILKNTLILGAAGAMLAFNVGKQAVTKSADWEQGVAKINATAHLKRNDLGRLDTRLTDIGSHSGGNFDRVPTTYENILSITGRVNQSLDLTEEAIRGAKAGFTDLDTVGAALARTMNTLDDKTVKAGDVLDYLMMAKNVGAGEFKDFAQYIPGLIAGAQPSGYNYKDAVTLFSTLSKTFEGNDASMYAQNLFTAFKKGDIIYGLEKAGVKVFDNGFRRPIADVLKDIGKLKMQMKPEQFTNFLEAIKLRDVQAATAIGAVTGNLGALTEVVNALAGAAGETDRALRDTENHWRTWGELADEYNASLKKLGDALLPLVDVVSEAVIGIIKGFTELFQFYKIFTPEWWTDANKNDEIKKQFDNKRSYEIAKDRTLEHYNLSPNQAWNNEQMAYYKSQQSSLAASFEKMHSLNNIKPDDEKSGTAAKQKAINAAKALELADENKKDSLSGSSHRGGGSGSGGNDAPNQLTMNLTVNNHFTTSKEDDRAIKRKITDTIVDSARDAMVVVGVQK